ncbi:ABC transporter substrate-binding protein [Psychrobacter sp. HD31]|uniref:siderophore ABC transporter substrate-binding protein n=1 Tax=Psychrobacter sp. HD31 TaxID=3112003 RepID=UPI003DA28C6E
MNNRLKTLGLAILVATSLIGCEKNNEQANNSLKEEATMQEGTSVNTQITVNTVKGDVVVPLQPKPIAVYDMSIMQNLVALGVEADGLPTNLLLDTFKIKGTESADIGTVFEPNFEKVHALKPQAIFIGGRASSQYDELNKIAPTLDLSLDWADMYGSSLSMLTTLGNIFDKSDKASELVNDIKTVVDETKQVTTGKGNGLILIVNGNKVTAAGAESRFGFIHNQLGIPMADNNIEAHTHGEPVSFEYIQKTNPDWLFVLDRTSAIGQEGPGALEVLDNDLIHQTKAWQKNQIIQLSPDSYLAFGGYYQWMKDAKAIKAAFEKLN